MLCIQGIRSYFCPVSMSCITLLSDFGLHDAAVASVKGILLQYTPQLPMVDISHMIEPYHLQQAAYILTSSYNSFPQGTCHLILFDVYADKVPTLVLCELEGHYFLAPDNGIIPLAFRNAPLTVRKCYQLNDENEFRDWVHVAGSVIQDLQSQPFETLDLPEWELKNAPQHWQPKIEEDVIESHVIHIDRFENVVTNVTRKEFGEVGKGRAFRIRFMRNEELNEISHHYSDVREGEKLCRFNAAGYLEIAINRGKAASLFGLKLHREHHVMYNTIKILFE